MRTVAVKEEEGVKTFEARVDDEVIGRLTVTDTGNDLDLLSGDPDQRLWAADALHSMAARYA